LTEEEKSYKLDSIRVEEVFVDCLFQTVEESINASENDTVLVDGIMTNVGFHKPRVESHREEIIQMLDQLPDQFKLSSKGKGWTFLNACEDKHGNLWTGDHAIVELLVIMGLAIGKVKYCFDREFWEILPGGVPYIQVLDENEKQGIDNL
jgi:hypothetical protein